MGRSMLDWAIVLLVVILLFGPILAWGREEEEPEETQHDHVPAWASIRNRQQALQEVRRRRPDSSASGERAAQARIGRNLQA